MKNQIITLDELRFNDLRHANVLRCIQSFHPLNTWSILEWCGASAGELGEALNVAKKIKRLDNPSKFTRATESDRAKLVTKLGKELADAVIYIDLTAAAAGIDLAKVTRQKFNHVSRRVGSNIFLEII